MAMSAFQPFFRNFLTALQNRSCGNNTKKFTVGPAKHEREKCVKSATVLGSTINYIDTESNSEKAVIFLHGNPTSSYLWRNVIPHVQGLARCFAPDLVGMGGSSKVPGCMYHFTDHYKYLSEWINKIDLPDKVNLVLHDWGSGLGFHWANQNRDRVQSITHMESIVRPFSSWDEFPESGRKIFQAMRSVAGEEIVLQKNIFVERILPSSIMRKLEDTEMDVYRKPFQEPGESRRPTLTWPRQIPIKGDGPDDVISLADDYNRWLSESEGVPKLFVSAKPGFFSPMIEEKTKSWPNHAKVTVAGLHFLQEDSPKEIGVAMHAFLKDVAFV